MKPKLDYEWYPENFDWYVKWAATVCMLLAMTARAAGIEYRMLDLVAGTLGVVLWLWVSVMWNDRALIILNATSAVLLGSALIREW
jgi:hypothetical protein